ncbi:MAG: GNAT family N-acetyltransferase [Mycobacterium sp.]
MALAAARAGAPEEWGSHLFFDDDGALCGVGGWKGPPSDGVVELGYAVAPERPGKGIATAVVRELLARASAAGVRCVIAHTLPEPSPSTGVLSRCGFVHVADVADPDAEIDGVVWRWEHQ